MSDVTLEELQRRLGDVAVLDVRTTGEYEGTAGYPCDPRQGHIPGARHVELASLGALSAEQLRERIALPEGAEIVVYCHSGSRSSVAVQLLRAAGYDARNYPGSWHEWSRAEELPEG